MTEKLLPFYFTHITGGFKYDADYVPNIFSNSLKLPFDTKTNTKKAAIMTKFA